jgi:hypothetical protein
MAGGAAITGIGRLLRESAERTAQVGVGNVLPNIGPNMVQEVINQNPTFAGFVLAILLSRGRAAGRLVAPIVIKITKVFFRR